MVQARAKRIFTNLQQTGGEEVDVIVLMNAVAPHVDLSFFHVTDLVEGGVFERSAAFLYPDGKVEILTAPLEEESARKAPEATVHLFENPEQKRAFFEERVKGKRVGIHPTELTYADYEILRRYVDGGRIVDAGKAIERARLVKDRLELERMQKAADIATKVADGIPQMLTDGLTEKELAAEINYKMQKLGASGASFDTIVGFGPGSAEPHYHPMNVKLTKGHFVLTDFGAWYNKYASDITRTYLYGRVSEEHKAVYETVLRAQEAAIAAMKPGAKAGDVHKAADDVINASKWKGRFIHSTGHSLGLAVHDGGVLHPRYDLTLEEGMVFTIEPGIYVPGFGGVRIEDDAVITQNGCRLLTSAKKRIEDVTCG
ncbi:MAG TPA: aminopeptidase P family protein [Candidatus Thermoplasmatota archaeon]|nr:aminopeptidase P family protein [Candidatus Thermoplasmatota archaeon]